MEDFDYSFFTQTHHRYTYDTQTTAPSSNLKIHIKLKSIVLYKFQNIRVLRILLYHCRLSRSVPFSHTTNDAKGLRLRAANAKCANTFKMIFVIILYLYFVWNDQHIPFVFNLTEFQMKLSVFPLSLLRIRFTVPCNVDGHGIFKE